VRPPGFSGSPGTFLASAEVVFRGRVSSAASFGLASVVVVSCSLGWALFRMFFLTSGLKIIL
jgi:hypothetical protein